MCNTVLNSQLIEYNENPMPSNVEQTHCCQRMRSFPQPPLERKTETEFYSEVIVEIGLETEREEHYHQVRIYIIIGLYSFSTLSDIDH